MFLGDANEGKHARCVNANYPYSRDVERHLAGKTSERKLRLLACGCCRRQMHGRLDQHDLAVVRSLNGLRTTRRGRKSYRQPEEPPRSSTFQEVRGRILSRWNG